MTMIRTQIYLERKQHAQLRHLAKERQTTLASLIRDVVDDFLTHQDEEEALKNRIHRLTRLMHQGVHLPNTGAWERVKEALAQTEPYFPTLEDAMSYSRGYEVS